MDGAIPMLNDPVYTLEEVAQLVKRSTRHVRRAIAQGELRCLADKERCPRAHIRVRRSAIEAWLKVLEDAGARVAGARKRAGRAA
ncbi:MAG: hypothetical protein AMXMBFR33_57940 [Candidatus Xenobia bacterium]